MAMQNLTSLCKPVDPPVKPRLVDLDVAIRSVPDARSAKTLKRSKFPRLFKLDSTVSQDPPHWWQQLFRRSAPALERLLGIDQINELCAYGADASSPFDFVGKCIEFLQIRPKISPEDLARIPKTGPVLVVANHPIGGIDGILLPWVLFQIRPDVKLMMNYLLARVPHLQQIGISVDPFGADMAAARNVGPLRDALRWLKDGGMLATFPAGEVAHRTLTNPQVTDPPWNLTIAKIARRAGAAVLPVYFSGDNGPVFQWAGILDARLRTALLPRAVFQKRGQSIEIRIGNVLPAKKIAGFQTDEETLSFVRRRTFLLQHRTFGVSTTKRLGSGKIVSLRQAVIDSPVAATLLAEELSRIPSEDLLVIQDEFKVFCTRACHIPHAIREIGRLREITFRATGEGTGESTDLDRFDSDYLHLFIWNQIKHEIVGAYRLGQTDVIVPTRGRAGLYSSTLFNYQTKLLSQLGPSLEMGRSFVRAEYQRSYAPLLLLWKGIGQFCVRHPRYKNLFGPVSISNTYQSVSRQLMVQFLKVHHLFTELSDLVRPRNPFKLPRMRDWDAVSVKSMVGESDDLSAMISELEPDQKGIPILLKQYLRMGARMLSFNLDPDFSDVVDALIVVDLTKTEPRLLEKYMSKQGYADFLTFHATTRSS